MFFSSVKFTAYLLIFFLFYAPSVLSEEFDVAKRKAAVEYINSFYLKKPPYRSKKETNFLFEKVISDITPSSKKICKVLTQEEQPCQWHFSIKSNGSFNAYASGENEIILFTGLVRNVYSKEELAFVIAHEVAHHIGQHIRKTKLRTIVGALAGLAIGASSNDPDIAIEGARIGATVGSLAYSTQQESEADRISIMILHESGYDLGLAKSMIIRMTRSSPGNVYSGFLSSHPSGPERFILFEEYQALFNKGLTYQEVLRK